MAKKQGPGIGKVHFLVSTFIFTISSILIVSLVYSKMMDIALAEAAHKAEIIIDRNLAIHKYFSTEMKPRLLRIAAARNDSSVISHELMSSIFAIRHIDKYVKSDRLNNYYYKEASINARSEENEAEGYEGDFIRKLNSGSARQRETGIVNIDGKPYFYAIQKGETITPECMACHGSPAAAPKGLVAAYGASKSFHRKSGEIISALSVRVPLSSAYDNIRDSFIILCALLVGLFGCAILAQMYLTGWLVISPIKRVRNMIFAGDDSLRTDPIPPQGGQELRDLISAFNSMDAELREKNFNMESLVQERTRELNETNINLSQEIAERKKTEQELVKERNLFQLIVDSISDGISIRDLNYRLTFISSMQLEMFGDTIGEKCYEVFAGKSDVCEDCPVKKSFEDGKSHVLTKEVVLPNGETRVFENTSCPIKDADGNIVAAMEINKDITERVKEEKRKEWAREQEKFAIIGKVAGKVAHDFNNILGIIMGMSGLLLRHETVSDDVRKKLTIINECSLKGKDLTNNLLLFARDQEPKYSRFDANECVSLVVESLSHEMEGVTVDLDLGDGLPPLVADRGLLENALVNLLKNSVHAVSMSENPKISVTSKIIDDNINITVSDNGCGVPPEHIDTIFDPAVTLKGSHDRTCSYKEGIKGSGYGLANVKRFVVKHNGKISVRSEPGKGAEFSISLPVINSSLKIFDQTTADSPNYAAGKRILLVEDEPVYSEILLAALESSGHFVDSALDGESALKMIETGNYDIVSLDFMLPDINGMDVYNKIREINSELPIVFVSGNFEYMQSMLALEKSDSKVGRLSKPFEIPEYVEIINKWLSNGVRR